MFLLTLKVGEPFLVMFQGIHTHTSCPTFRWCLQQLANLLARVPPPYPLSQPFKAPVWQMDFISGCFPPLSVPPVGQASGLDQGCCNGLFPLETSCSLSRFKDEEHPRHLARKTMKKWLWRCKKNHAGTSRCWNGSRRVCVCVLVCLLLRLIGAHLYGSGVVHTSSPLAFLSVPSGLLLVNHSFCGFFFLWVLFFSSVFWRSWT